MNSNSDDASVHASEGEDLHEAAMRALVEAAPARLEALRAAALVGEGPLPSLDRLTRLARRVTGTPAAWIALVYEDEIHIRSASFTEQSGIGPEPIPLDSNPLSAQVLLAEQPLIIDAVSSHALGSRCEMLARLGIEAYVGVPIRVQGSPPLGVLCVGAFGPRAWTAEQLEALGDLAEAVSAEIELRGRTRRLSAEQQALRASRERHRFQAGLLDAVGQAVDAVDLDFKVRYWNRAAETLHGWTAEEAIGQPVAFMIPEHAQPHAGTVIARLITGEMWSGEFPLMRKNGSSFPAWVTVSPLQDAEGSVVGFVGVWSDISESKRVAERHRAFSSFGQKLNTTRSPREVAEVILDMADRLIGWDCCWLDICNLETQRSETIALYDEVEGKRVEVAAPASDLSVDCFTMRALRDGGFLVLRSAQDLERLRSAASRPLSFGDTGRPSASIMVVPIRLGPRPIGALSIQSYQLDAYDTHQLELLQTLADYCAGALERAAAEQARDHLQEQLLQAQKMEAIGRLAGGVAHDFNNMLAVINGYSGLLLGRVPPDSDLREPIALIGEAGRRATDFTRQLLTFSRKGLLEPMPIDLASVIHGMEKMLQRLIGEDIELTTACTELPGEVLADPGQIEQVLMNLVINSRDAMPEGGKLSICVAPAVPDAHFLREHPEIGSGNYAHLEVKDTGVGMTEGVRQRIFEPFFTTKAAGKGTGLGLSTVFGIIRQCGGCVDVESAAGRGTTFHVYFPLTETQDEAAANEELGSPARGNEIVLLAEDEPMVSRLVKQVLNLQGYQVLTAHTGEEALRLTEDPATQVDLLLTDVVMPGGMNGRELAERLRATRPELRVLYMSGYTEDEILRAGLHRAEVAFIHKPFSPDDLLREVRRVLDEG